MKRPMHIFSLFVVCFAFSKATGTDVTWDADSRDNLLNNDETSSSRMKLNKFWNKALMHSESRKVAARYEIRVKSRSRRYVRQGSRSGIAHGGGPDFHGRRSRHRFNRRGRHHGMRSRPHWMNQNRQQMGMRGDFGPYIRNVQGRFTGSREGYPIDRHHANQYGGRPLNSQSWYRLQQEAGRRDPDSMGMPGYRRGNHGAQGGGYMMRFGDMTNGFGPGSHGRYGRRRGGCRGCRGHHFGPRYQFSPSYYNHHQHHQYGISASEIPRDNGSEDHVSFNTQLPLLPNIRRKLDFLATSQNKLNLKLHREIAMPRSNVVYSPYGVYQSLAMVYLGSRRRTAFQMMRFLNLISMGRHIHFPIMHQNNLLDNTTSSTLEMVNAIFVPSNISVNRVYSDMLASTFRANVSHVDEENNLEDSVNEMAVSGTNNLIQSVVRDTLPQQPLSLTLMNVMYFQGKWKTPFPVDQTVEQTFHQSSSSQVPMDMMAVEGLFKVGLLPGHSAKLLELPYADDRFSMLVILPDEVDGLPEIEESLTEEDLGVSLDTSIPTRVRVFLPKFKIETSLLLKEHLKHIGMGGAFEASSATLDVMSQNHLHVNDLIHKAVVEVVEDGEELSANMIPETVDETEVPEFRCDHPFLFIIRDHISEVNLFVGKFSGEIA